MAERFGLSQRRVCRFMAFARNTLRYCSRRPEDAARRVRIRELAESKRRDGCPRIYIRLRRAGGPAGRSTIRRWNGSMIATQSDHSGGADGRSWQRFLAVHSRGPLSPGAVM